jgi:ornithine carbamoyltransferase
MIPTSPPALPDRATRPAPGSVDALEAAVALLKAQARAGGGRPPLGGRNIGILCDEAQRPEVFLLQRAATELGARVALVRFGLDEAGASLAVEKTGRVLGQLYDALICVDVPAPVVERLGDAAGIPTVANLATDWIALRAAQPDGDDDGRYLLQALLVDACR